MSFVVFVLKVAACAVPVGIAGMFAYNYFAATGEQRVHLVHPWKVLGGASLWVVVTVLGVWLR